MSTKKAAKKNPLATNPALTARKQYGKKLRDLSVEDARAILGGAAAAKPQKQNATGPDRSSP